MQLALAQHAGVIPLAQHLVHADRDGVGKVEAAGIRVVAHGNAHAVLPVGAQQLLRQARRLLSEHQVTAVRILRLGMRPACLG